VYGCKDHAEQFINGIFRLGCPGYYRNMEDVSRCDLTEGRGHTREFGEVTVGLVSPNPAEKTIWTKELGYQDHRIEMNNKIFCYCMCLPDVNHDHMKKNFGKYIVKINDPRKLAEDVNDFLFNSGREFLIEGCDVVYNKGQNLDKKLSDNERNDLAYKQKPEKFHLDCEFRIVATELGAICDVECKFLDVDGQRDPKCPYIEINLGRKLEYLNLIDNE
jgi:hypothetical protein